MHYRYKHNNRMYVYVNRMIRWMTISNRWPEQLISPTTQPICQPLDYPVSTTQPVSLLQSVQSLKRMSHRLDPMSVGCGCRCVVVLMRRECISICGLLSFLLSILFIHHLIPLYTFFPLKSIIIIHYLW